MGPSWSNDRVEPPLRHTLSLSNKSKIIANCFQTNHFAVNFDCRTMRDERTESISRASCSGAVDACCGCMHMDDRTVASKNEPCLI